MSITLPSRFLSNTSLDIPDISTLFLLLYCSILIFLRITFYGNIISNLSFQIFNVINQIFLLHSVYPITTYVKQICYAKIGHYKHEITVST